jgi:methionyl-tRNA formyltransferase
MNKLRIIFLGMAGATSLIVLEALLSAGADIRAMVIGVGGGADGEPIGLVSPPPSASLLPIANPFAQRTIAHMAWERAIPAFELRDPAAPLALSTLSDLRPDVACVACFPRRIPKAMLDIPPHGFLNMHPSLLPRHRGPEPLFWTFRDGETRTGVTIHRMTDMLDAGDIVAQAPLALPDGISGARAEAHSAALGGRLLGDALRDLAAGVFQPCPQPPGGSYEPAPAVADFRIAANWPARRAFNFMRGTAEWGQPYPIALDDTELLLAEALWFDAEATLGKPYIQDGDEVTVQLAPGVLHARCA